MSTIIKITFTDGTIETIDRVDGYEVRDGVLSAYRQSMYRQDLGHWPIINIRKWLTDEHQ